MHITLCIPNHTKQIQKQIFMRPATVSTLLISVLVLLIDTVRAKERNKTVRYTASDEATHIPFLLLIGLIYIDAYFFKCIPGPKYCVVETSTFKKTTILVEYIPSYQ